MPPDRTAWTWPAVAAVVGFAVLVGLIGWYLSGTMPGTLRFDETGAAHGSGWKTYRYSNGRPKVEEYFVAGVLRFSRWRRPDGSVVDQTTWRRGTGTGYFLRDDGSVRAVLADVDGVAVATAYYDAGGQLVRQTGAGAERRVP